MLTPWDVPGHIKKGELLSHLEDNSVNTQRLEEFIEEYGDLLLFLFDVCSVTKARSSEYAKLDKYLIAYEAQAVPTDVLKSLMEEFQAREDKANNVSESKARSKKYSN